MRLTQKDERGNWNLRGVKWEQLQEGQVITEGLRERLYGALWKLMEYEDTGLTPEWIREMDALYIERCREVTKLNERLAVLRTPD